MLAELRSMTLVDAVIAFVDIAIVSYVFYRILLLIRGTRAVQLIKGLLVVILAYQVSDWLGLRTITYLLGQVQVGLIVAIPVVFQPELRRALEQLGRGRLFSRSFYLLEQEDVAELIDNLIEGVTRLARNKTGALIVIERDTGLNDIVDTGIRVDGLVTPEFLVNLFIPKTPLHDGAVIIRGNRVLAAACFLPLTEDPNIDPELGGRHRAGLGITEHSDAVSVVVSEETGQISLANNGKLIRNMDEETLREMLDNLLEAEDGDVSRQQPFFWQR